jgi:hypothetical protein
LLVQPAKVELLHKLPRRYATICSRMHNAEYSRRRTHPFRLLMLTGRNDNDESRKNANKIGGFPGDLDSSRTWKCGFPCLL